MKLRLAIILSLLYSASLAQHLEFNNEPVDTICLQSHSSSYQFDDKGTTKGKVSVIYLVFNEDKDSYSVNQYYTDEYIRTFKPDTINVKTKDLRDKMGKDISRNHLEELLKSLNKNIEPTDLIDQIDTSAFRQYMTEKQIRKIAKKHKVDWYFKRKYSNNEDNKSFFSSCRSLDTLRLYLKNRFDKQGYKVVTDVSNTINIWITTANSRYRFEGKYPHPVKQPWYIFSDSSLDVTKSVLNLEINQSLVKILPHDFLLIETISEKALFDDYLKWYFERRKMKY